MRAAFFLPVFEKKTALITGGSSGIGLALAHALRTRGANVAILSRSGVRLKAAVESLERIASPGTVETFRADVRNYRDLKRVARDIESKAPLDFLINSAGMVRPGRFEELPVSMFRRTMAANVLGTVHSVRAVIPAMISRKSGMIVNVGSIAGMIGVYGYTAYSASKFAIHGFTQSLRAEMKPHGIHVLLAAPPDTDTPMLREERKLLPPETAAINSSGGLLSADAVAAAIVEAMIRKRKLVVPGLEGKTAYFASRFVPGIVDAVMDRKIRSVRKLAGG